MVGAGRAGERANQWCGSTGAADPRGWLADRGRAEIRAIRSDIRQHPGAAAASDGARPGAQPRTRRRRDPRGIAEVPGPRRPGGTSAMWADVATADPSGAVDDNRAPQEGLDRPAWLFLPSAPGPNVTGANAQPQIGDRT